MDLETALEGMVTDLPTPSFTRNTPGRKRSSVADDSDVRSVLRRTKFTFMEKLTCNRKGCICVICAKKDNTADPVSPDFYILWAYVVPGPGPEFATEVQGTCCYYCYRVWNVKFMDTYKLAKYKEEMGKDRQSIIIRMWIKARPREDPAMKL